MKPRLGKTDGTFGAKAVSFRPGPIAAATAIPTQKVIKSKQHRERLLMLIIQ